MPTVTVIQPTIAAEQNTKIRCAAYCRVSSDSEDQLNSFMAQTRYYEKAFENSETEQLVDIYADEGITGTREDKRDEYQRMISDCRKGKIDRIYTKSISRFARNTKDCLKNIRELKSLGITVLFEKESIDTADMTDEMMITIMGGLAQEESTSISQNLRWSCRKRMANGTYELSCPPYGYKKVNGKLVICPEQAKVVKEIYDSYLSGIGMISIMKNLNERNIPCCKNSERWHMIGVSYILTNEKYTGNTLLQKTYSTNTLPVRRFKNNGNADQYYVRNTHPAIIQQETFDKVQRLISEKNQKQPRGTPHNSVLHKHIFCGSCGSILIRKSCRKKYYWSCRKHDLAAVDCPTKQISEDKIHSAFIRLYNKLVYNFKPVLTPLQQALQDLKYKNTKSGTTIIEKYKEIAKLKEQTHVLARLKTKGFLDEAKYLEQTTELNSKIAKLQTKIKKLNVSDEEDETLEQLDMIIGYFEKRQKLMVEFEELAFESIVDKIVVKNQNELEFHLIGGLELAEEI